GIALHELWLCVLRAGNGAHAIFQRRRGYMDADLDQPLLLLVVGDSASVRPRTCAELRSTRRIPRHHDRLLVTGAGQQRALSPRTLEVAQGIAGSAKRPVSIEQGCHALFRTSDYLILQFY